MFCLAKKKYLQNSGFLFGNLRRIPSARRGFWKSLGQPAGPSGFSKSPLGFGGFVRRFPPKNPNFLYKFTPWLVLHVLHFIGNFFYNPRASLARAAFKRDFLVKLKAISFFLSKLRKVKFKVVSEKKVKWSESESESIFGPLNFFAFRYVERGALVNNFNPG